MSPGMVWQFSAHALQRIGVRPIRTTGARLASARATALQFRSCPRDERRLVCECHAVSLLRRRCEPEEHPGRIAGDDGAGGTCEWTTEPADTMLPSPIRTPGKIMQQWPIQTLSPMTTSRTWSGRSLTARRAEASDAWPLESTTDVPPAIMVLRPIVTLLPQTIEQPWPKPELSPMTSVGSSENRRGERKRALPVDQDVVADDDPARP